MDAIEVSPRQVQSDIITSIPEMIDESQVSWVEVGRGRGRGGEERERRLFLVCNPSPVIPPPPL